MVLVLGDVLEEARRWVDCEYGSCDAIPIRLSTDMPSCRTMVG